MVESENAQLREQIEDMERELDYSKTRITDMEAELKLLRSEREQFEEMCVRLEIQTKELGVIMRDQKGGTGKKTSPRSGQPNSVPKGAVSSSTTSSQLLRGMKFMVNKFARSRKAPLAPQGASEKATNLTTVISSPPGGRGDFTLTARSGHFSNGSVSLGKGLAADPLAKEFAVLRGDNMDGDMDLNNTVEAVDFKY